MAHPSPGSAARRPRGRRRIAWSLLAAALLASAAALWVVARREPEGESRGSRFPEGASSPSAPSDAGGARPIAAGPVLHGRARPASEPPAGGGSPPGEAAAAPEHEAASEAAEALSPMTGWEAEEEVSTTAPVLSLPAMPPVARVGLPARWMDDAPIYTVGFTPDVRRVVSAGEASELVVRDVATGEVQCRLLGHKPGGISDLAVGSDGRRVLTGGYDSTARLWDLETQSCVRVLDTPGGRVASVEFDATGRLGVLGGDLGAVLLWDLDTGDVTQRFDCAGSVNCACLSSDGRVLAACSSEGMLRVWNAATKAVVWEKSAHTGSADELAYLPAEDRFASSGSDGWIRVWERSDGALAREWKAHEGRVSEFAVSPDGRTIATGGWEGRVRHASLADGSPLWDHQWHTDLIVAMAFSGDGRLVASGARDGLTQLWDAASGAPISGEPTALEGHSGAVNALVFAGANLVSCGQDGTIRVWDLPTRSWTRLLRPPGGAAVSIAADGPGHVLLAGGARRLGLWDLDAGREVWGVDPPSEEPGAAGAWCGLAPSGVAALWSLGGGGLAIHEGASGALRRRLEGSVAGLSVSPLEGLVAVLRIPTTSIDLLALDGTLVRNVRFAPPARTGAAVWFPDGRSLLVGCRGGAMRVEVRNGSVSARYDVGFDALGLAVTPDGRGVLLALASGDLALLDADGGEPRRHFSGPKRPATCIAVSPDGRSAASGGPDGAIFLWDLGG